MFHATERWDRVVGVSGYSPLSASPGSYLLTPIMRENNHLTAVRREHLPTCSLARWVVVGSWFPIPESGTNVRCEYLSEEQNHGGRTNKRTTLIRVFSIGSVADLSSHYQKGLAVLIGHAHVAVTAPVAEL